MDNTTNIQLNQWEKTDRIRMEDFNADNAKLDETLLAMQDAIAAAAAACPIVKLLDITTTAAKTRLDIDVSHIDFTQYHQVDVYFRCEFGSYNNIQFFLNEEKEKEYYPTKPGGSSSSYSNSNNISTMALWRLDATLTHNVHLDLHMPSAGGFIRCALDLAGVSHDHVDQALKNYSSTSITWSTLRKLIFASTGTAFPAGTRVIIMGEKD